MVRLVALVVCLVAGCTLHEPLPPTVPPGPEDLSTWGTPEMVGEAFTPPTRPRPALVPEPPPTPAEKVYRFVPGGTYAVPVAPNAPLDIQFQPGEQVHKAVISDRLVSPDADGASTAGPQTCKRWCIEEGLSGLGEHKRGHIFVTVTEPGLKNGLTITTTQAVYAINLESVKQTPTRFLRWTHVTPAVEPEPTEPALLGPLPDTSKPSRWRVGYTIQAQGARPDWLPQGAWDDGKKIYVLLPKTSLYGTSPLVRKIGPNGPAVVNGRQYLNVLIVDELAGMLELRVGVGDPAEVVRITRGPLRIVQCPDDAACPTFPQLQGGQS
jgi:type IV secretion system protein TrbG